MNPWKMAGLFDNDVFKSWWQHQVVALLYFATAPVVLVAGIFALSKPLWVYLAFFAVFAAWSRVLVALGNMTLPAPRPIPPEWQ